MLSAKELIPSTCSVGGETLQSPLDSKEILPVSPKENQPWIFIRRTNAEAEAPILWPSDAKTRLVRRDPDAEEGWRQEEMGMTKDEMVGWYHCLNEHEFQQTLGNSEAWGNLVCFSPWGHKYLDITEWLNNNNNKYKYEMISILQCYKKFKMQKLNQRHWERLH